MNICSNLYQKYIVSQAVSQVHGRHEGTKIFVSKAYGRERNLEQNQINNTVFDVPDRTCMKKNKATDKVQE